MKKKLITAAILTVSAILLVAASVLGTLAFLASSSAVSNTFTVGDVGIQMFESKTDENGQDLDGDNATNKKTSDGNSYKLVPGKSYVKDPTIYVKEDSVPSYLFVKVKNGISTIEKQGDASAPTIAEQMVSKGWQAVKANDAGEVLYLYVGAGNATSDVKTGAVPAVAVGSAVAEQYDIFDNFTVDTSAAVADYAGAKVTLTAFAIQTEGFNTADGLEGYQHAWNAIVGRFPFESGTVYTAG